MCNAYTSSVQNSTKSISSSINLWEQQFLCFVLVDSSSQPIKTNSLPAYTTAALMLIISSIQREFNLLSNQSTGSYCDSILLSSMYQQHWASFSVTAIPYGYLQKAKRPRSHLIGNCNTEINACLTNQCVGFPQHISVSLHSQGVLTYIHYWQ